MTEASSHKILKPLLVSQQGSDPAAGRCGTSHQEPSHGCWAVHKPTPYPCHHHWNTACPEASPQRPSPETDLLRQLPLPTLPTEIPPRRRSGDTRMWAEGGQVKRSTPSAARPLELTDKQIHTRATDKKAKQDRQQIQHTLPRFWV